MLQSISAPAAMANVPILPWDIPPENIFDESKETHVKFLRWLLHHGVDFQYWGRDQRGALDAFMALHPEVFGPPGSISYENCKHWLVKKKSYYFYGNTQNKETFVKREMEDVVEMWEEELEQGFRR